MKVRIPLELYRIDADGVHIAIKCKMNGIPQRLIIDTGASKTVLDESKLAAIMDASEFISHDQLSTTIGSNAIESKIARIQSLKFKGVNISNFEVAVMDLEHLHQSYAQLGLPKVIGVLGGDFLRKHRAIIDYKKKRLIFQQKSQG